MLTPYGPEGAGVDLVAAIDALELEYAAIRKFAALFDQPHRGVIEITGGDRVEFLNRMLTQELKGIAPFQARPSFWLNRKGRIEADLRVIELPGRTLFDLDVHAVARTVEGLSSYVITEDVAVADLTASTHRLALHGPRALDLLVSATTAEDGPALEALAPRQACTRRAGGATLTVFRDDSTGAPGYGLIVPTNQTGAVYDLLMATGHDPEPGVADALRTVQSPGARLRLRPIGWHAFNVARIEAGTPLYNVDFGPDSLPAQTGVLHDRVSFTKGCYLGQEVVARMHSRGHSKSILRRLLVERAVMPTDPVMEPTQDSRPEQVFQPVSGARVYAAGATPDSPGEPVGAVTSSCVSPLMGSSPVCFAQLKPEAAQPEAELMVAVDDRLLRATVRAELSSLRG